MVKLYCFPGAPNPDKLRLYLAEKLVGGADITLDEIFVNLRSGEQYSPEHLSRNPFGKLPVLQLDDASCITESLAIIEYFEELHPEPSLIGRCAWERAKTRELERICDLRVLIPIGRIIHATRPSSGKAPAHEIARHAQAMLSTALRVLNDQLSDGRPFMTGATPSIADCTLAAALAFARCFKLKVIDDYEHLHRWDSTYRSRPVAQSILLF